MQSIVSFPSAKVRYFLDSSINELWQSYDPASVIIITDEHLEALYPHVLGNIKTIVLPPGEDSKSLSTAEHIIKQLLKMEATRQTVLIGIGGGVISDITGFVASVYMRGITFGFVPTTLLGMVDAAIGGKNGVNIGLNKNIAGTITQPSFLLFDTSFLHTLPDPEWSNGFAEIIKYACIFDGELFDELSHHDVNWYKQNEPALQAVINRCVAWKNKTVIEDEKETGKRKLLNFGHTAAHAIEKLYDLPHGRAVSVGMVIAATLAQSLGHVDHSVTEQLKSLLTRYDLPVSHPIDVNKAVGLLRMDKKRNNDHIDYILLRGVGRGFIHPISFTMIENAMAQCAQ